MTCKHPRLPAALLLCALSACSGAPDATSNQSALNAQQADDALDAALNAAPETGGEESATQMGTLVPPAPGEPGGLPDDREPLNEGAARNPTSVEASGATIERWGLALGEGRYDDAYRLWRDNGRQSGMSAAQFAEVYRKYSEIHVLVGRPQAGGTQTARVPVQMYGRLRDGGKPFNLIGTMTLARNPAGQKGEAGQTPWLIASADLKPLGTVKVLPPEASAAPKLVPAAFRGAWSGSEVNCGKPGDDMRLRVEADSLVFYESVGTITAVQPLSPERVRVTADYQGEGETWSNSATLVLSDGGDALTIGNAKRVRCSA